MANKDLIFHDEFTALPSDLVMHGECDKLDYLVDKAATQSAEKVEIVDSCTVILDGVAVSSNDFIAVTYNPSTAVSSLHYNTDALSLGISIKLLMHAFAVEMSKVTPEENAAIKGILEQADMKEIEDGQD